MAGGREGKKGFRDQRFTAAGRSVAVVNVITRQDNAVSLTRVVNPDSHGDPDVMVDIRAPPNAEIVETIRREATAAAHTLDAF